ncbi:MAG TPA: cytochrome c biogenesis protein CcdA [Bacillota bacterium]|jgi:cytochrome c-type biogenesis protein
MESAQAVGLGVAFVAGLASFFSPCVVPLVPTYLTYLAGSAGREGDGLGRRQILNAVAFVLGFTLVFLVLGLGAAGLGTLTAALRYRGLLRRLGGIVVVVLGLQLTGLIQVGFLEREARPDLGPGLVRRGAGVGRSALVGMAFSFGWTPCVGPVLASILVMAAGAASLSRSLALLLAYSAGLALPFLAAAVFLDPLMGWLRRRGRVLEWISRASGALLVLMGLALYFNYLVRFEAWLSR